MNEYGTSEVRLDFDTVLSAATGKAGLTEFGDEGFFEPLQVLLKALRDEANLTSAGQVGQFTRIVDILVNRLRIEHYFLRFPEIAQEKIAAPVVIVGLMRTGTTMLHRMLASDRRFYAPLWYELRYPAPFPEYDFDGPDARIPQAEAEVEAMFEANPDLSAIHPLDACEPDEEILLLEHSFYSTVPESMLNIPSYSKWLESHDNTPGYRYLEKVLQFLQWQKRKKGQQSDRWLLKTPHHLHHLDILLKVFPDAKIVHNHRDPLQTIPSLCSFNYALSKMASDSADPLLIGTHWCDKFSRSLKRAMQLRDNYPEHFFDVQYRPLVSEPLAVVKKLYEFIDMSLDTDAQATIVRWQTTNNRAAREAHRYTVEQFGFTDSGLKHAFSAYRDTYIECGKPPKLRQL